MADRPQRARSKPPKGAPPSVKPEPPATPERPPRVRMVLAAAALLSERGLSGTSFSEVIERSGAPRGDPRPGEDVQVGGGVGHGEGDAGRLLPLEEAARGALEERRLARLGEGTFGCYDVDHGHGGAPGSRMTSVITDRRLTMMIVIVK